MPNVELSLLLSAFGQALKFQLLEGRAGKEPRSQQLPVFGPAPSVGQLCGACQDSTGRMILLDSRKPLRNRELPMERADS